MSIDLRYTFVHVTNSHLQQVTVVILGAFLFIIPHSHCNSHLYILHLRVSPSPKRANMGVASSQESPIAPGSHPRSFPPLGQRSQEILEPPVGMPGPPLPTTSGNTIPVRAHPPVQQKSIVRNSLSLQKNTLRVVPSPRDPQILLVDFEFNAEVPGNITVYYHAREVITHSDGTTNISPMTEGGRNHRAPVVRLAYDSDGRPAARTPFPKGHAQWYRQHPSRGLDTRLYSTEQLLADGTDGHYALVVRLEAAQKPTGEEVAVQTTFAVIENLGQQGWDTKVTGQQVLIQGSVYKMMDLFGIGARNVTATRDNSDDKDNEFKLDASQECVVCLSEICTTAVRPCHHLCLCGDCARIICSEMNENRRRCPVCRTKMESVFTILPPPTTSVDGDEMTETEREMAEDENEPVDTKEQTGPLTNTITQVINESVLHPDGVITTVPSPADTTSVAEQGNTVSAANGATANRDN